MLINVNYVIALNETEYANLLNSQPRIMHFTYSDLWGAKVDINANCKKSFLIYKFTFSTQDFCSNIANFMVTW